MIVSSANAHAARQEDISCLSLLLSYRVPRYARGRDYEMSGWGCSQTPTNGRCYIQFSRMKYTLTCRRSWTVAACLLLVAVLKSRADVPSGDVCPHPGDGSPSCVCQHPNGRIDLTPLVNGSGGIKYPNIGPDANGYVYDYNPCYTFSSTTPCTDAYICQHNDAGNYFMVGASGSESIYIDDQSGAVYVYYKAPTGDGNTREAWVQLVCNQNLGSGQEVITTTGDKEVGLLYRFVLSSCYACPGGCHPPKKSTGTIAGPIGIAIIFIAIIALAAYFIIGAVILKVRYQKTGSDIIPNKGFWFALPILLKDGCLLTILPCRKLINRNNYEKM